MKTEQQSFVRLSCLCDMHVVGDVAARHGTGRVRLNCTLYISSLFLRYACVSLYARNFCFILSRRS